MPTAKTKKSRTWTSDEAHNMTERELGKLQRRIEGVFEECQADMEVTISDYWGKLKGREKKMQQALKDGKITKEQYQAWYKAQIGRGRNFEALRDKLAQRAAESSSLSHDIIKGTLPNFYAINRNYAAYQIESITGADFTLWNEHTVRRLLVEKPDLMPHYPIMRAIDKEYNLAYCKTKITDVVTAGILQGLSIDQMQKKLAADVSGMERVSAVRAARTATTSAENAGRMDEFEEAKSLGLDFEKEWMATLDGRTRHSHGMLDGVHVPMNKKFDNGLMHPGDPSGAPWEVYNCRCTLVPYFADLDAKWGGRRQSYKEWREEKEKNGRKLQINDKATYQEIRDMMAANVPKLTQEIARNAFEKLRGVLGNEFVEGADRTLRNCGNDSVIAVFEKYGEEIKIGSSTQRGGGYFAPGDGVCFNAKKSFESNPQFHTFFHEVGHNLDYIFGNKDPWYYHSSSILSEALKKDFQYLKGKAYEFKGKKTKAAVLSMFYNTVINDAERISSPRKYTSVSDILEGLTGENSQIGAGHGAYYFKNGIDMTEKEFYAECFESIITNKASWEQMQAFFPNSTEAFLKAMEDLIK